MSKPKFKEGPWKVGARTGAYVYIDAPCGQTPHFELARVVVDIEGEADEQSEANANLIAAAPQLYECLQDARDFIATTLAQVGDGHRISELAADFDAALAKARGEA